MLAGVLNHKSVTKPGSAGTRIGAATEFLKELSRHDTRVPCDLRDMQAADRLGKEIFEAYDLDGG